jgi:hypothetical protein
MEKKNNAVQIPKELAWLFTNDEDSKKKRKDYVDEFFGLNQIDEALNTKKEEN